MAADGKNNGIRPFPVCSCVLSLPTARGRSTAPRPLAFRPPLSAIVLVLAFVWVSQQQFVALFGSLFAKTTTRLSIFN